ncbi:MAG TPA: transcription termination/antitermination protein NusA [Candidatus Yonathbacteria bacterium]|nr:transcription termination/antitermination protein NusA [Candidatus Yonathbacteria bacterium]
MDLKMVSSALIQLEEERGIPKEKILEAIEQALAAAYKKDYGKKGQIVNANFDINSGKTEFSQVKIVVDESEVRMEEEDENSAVVTEDKKLKGKGIVTPDNNDKEEDELIRFNPEHHILLEDAKKIKKDVVSGEELVFPLEAHDDYGRIAAQTAKQVIVQRIREAEKVSVIDEFGQKQGSIVSGGVQRIERGTIFIDLGKTTGIIPYDEQLPGERYRQGERIRAYLYSVEETPRGVHLKLSRSHPKFIEKLFELEAPEIANEVVEIKSVAREAGSRSKIAVFSHDDHIDPVGSCVGQRGIRVSTVMSELGGEKIDIIEWSENPREFIEDALSPAKVLDVKINEEEHHAIVEVSEDQLSLAIGKGGQNVRLAAKLTGWKIDIRGSGEEVEVGIEEKPEEATAEEKPQSATYESSAQKTPEESPSDVAEEIDSNEGEPENLPENVETEIAEKEEEDTEKTATTEEESEETTDKKDKEE